MAAVNRSKKRSRRLLRSGRQIAIRRTRPSGYHSNRVLLRVSIFPEVFILMFGGMVQVEELGDAVPQAPWDLSLLCCSSRRWHRATPVVTRPSAVCSLQTALGLRPRRALSSAGEKAGRFMMVVKGLSRFRYLGGL